MGEGSVPKLTQIGTQPGPICSQSPYLHRCLRTDPDGGELGPGSVLMCAGLLPSPSCLGCISGMFMCAWSLTQRRSPDPDGPCDTDP